MNKKPRKYRLPPPPPTTVVPDPVEIIELHPQTPPVGNPVRLVPSGPPVEIIELWPNPALPETKAPDAAGAEPGAA